MGVGTLWSRLISWTHYRVSGPELLNKPVPEGEEMPSELHFLAVILLVTWVPGQPAMRRDTKKPE